jgi:tetratricopeptide (TPR) repeat protein
MDGSTTKSAGRHRQLRCYDRRVLRERSQHSDHPQDTGPGGSYTRKEVCRLLKIEIRQLRTWERQQLIPELPEYRFADLLSLKTIVRLRAEKANPRAIRLALDGLRSHLKDSVASSSGSMGSSSDVRVYKEGRRVRLQIGKHKMEPASGQLLFDFTEQEITKLLHLPRHQKAENVAEKLQRKLEADRWFERGLDLEQKGAAHEEVIEAYGMAAKLDPTSPGALVNLGTAFFNGHAWAAAEEQYKKALELNPDYALAHFNLGNLYDEQGDSETALHHYEQAVRIHPTYADAHYNLALLQQSLRNIMGAVRHWRAYIKLDGSSAWSQIARRELEKLQAQTLVHGNRHVSSKLKA